MKHLLFLALWSLADCATPAVAQELTPALDPVIMGQGMAMNAAILAQAENLKANPKTSTGPEAGAARLTYTPTPALRQQTVQQLVRRLHASNLAQAQAVEASFKAGKTDYAQLYTVGLKGSGFQDNDAASALAAYLELGYVAVNNVTNTASITPAIDRRLRNQAAALINQRKLSSPAVAQFGEEMKLQTVLLQAGWQQSQQNGQASSFRAAVARLFTTQYGLDFTKLKLTGSGLARK